MRRVVAISAAALLVGALASINASGAVRKPAADPLGRARAGANTAPFTHWCNTNGITCAEPYQNWEDFRFFDHIKKRVNIQEYIGHDEPSVLFYSNQPGSGNDNTYNLTLPRDAAIQPRQDQSGGTWNFQLRPTFWLGMAMCDNESAPNPDWPGSLYPASTHCTPDSDNNIFTGQNPGNASHYIGAHPGTAFMEMQFYPPGWVPWPAGISCDAHKWCAALNIDSLSIDENQGLDGLNNNDACLNSAGIEPVNFAFLTPSGTADTSADPLNNNRFTPGPHTFLMGSGDRITVHMFDTANGLVVRVDDLTTGTTGRMVASSGNGFASVRFEPNAQSCSITKHAFHPEYSTTNEDTRVPWAAHSYNVAFSDEIGHFEYCNKINLNSPFLACKKPGGFDTNSKEDPLHDDLFCFPVPGIPSTLVNVKGCLSGFDSDLDFDGVSYDARAWPGSIDNAAADAALTPRPVQFTSPTFSGGQNYSRVAFEADLPRIEDFRPDAPFGGVQVNCQRFITNPSNDPAPADPHPGRNCVKPPPQSRFYPFYSTATVAGQCNWQLGGRYLPGTTRRFGRVNEYGRLLVNDYPTTDTNGNPAVTSRFNDFRQILASNPCPA